jgi:hypothetical protein
MGVLKWDTHKQRTKYGCIFVCVRPHCMNCNRLLTDLSWNGAMKKWKLSCWGYFDKKYRAHARACACVRAWVSVRSRGWSGFECGAPTVYSGDRSDDRGFGWGRYCAWCIRKQRWRRALNTVPTPFYAILRVEHCIFTAKSVQEKLPKLSCIHSRMLEGTNRSSDILKGSYS